MNIARVIESVSLSRKGYNIDEATLIEGINKVEEDILLNVVKGREGDSAIEGNYGGYDIDTDRGTELFAPPPYDGIYAEYLIAMIDRMYEDADRYPQSAATYMNTFESLKAYWFRTHRQNRKYRYHF